MAGLFTEEQTEEGQQEADQQTGDDGKVNSGAVAADDDVTGQAIEEGNAVGEEENQSDQEEQDPRKNQRFAQFRRHDSSVC